MRVLQFSGGKDSIACLLLLKDQLADITVMWANSGDTFPETLRQMEKVREMCPNFIEVMGDQPEVIQTGGYPVDVLPMRNHKEIARLSGQNRVKLQGFLECCFNSFLLPMHNAAIDAGATEIIRGQKLCDGQKSPVRSGDVIDGIKYSFPIENWTDAQVMEFVKDSGLLTENYSIANTSLDCMHCTAYLAENKWKLTYLEARHPEVAVEVRSRLGVIRGEIARDAELLNEILGS